MKRLVRNERYEGSFIMVGKREEERGDLPAMKRWLSGSLMLYILYKKCSQYIID